MIFSWKFFFFCKPDSLSFFLLRESGHPHSLAVPGVASYYHTAHHNTNIFKEIINKINVKMALCQYFLGNKMAPSSHVTAANQSKSRPELARLSLYTALASTGQEQYGSLRVSWAGCFLGTYKIVTPAELVSKSEIPSRIFDKAYNLV